MAKPRFLVSSSGLALTSADILTLQKDAAPKLLAIRGPAAGNPDLPVCPDGEMEPGRLYPSAAGPHRKLYLPRYRIARDGAQDSLSLSTAMLRVDITAPVPAEANVEVDDVPHVLSARLEYWQTDNAGKPTNRETLTFPSVEPVTDGSDPSRRRLVLPIENTGLLGRIARAMQKPAAGATLVLEAHVSVGVEGGDQTALPDDVWSDTTGIPPLVLEVPPPPPVTPQATAAKLVSLAAHKNSDGRVEVFGIAADRTPWNVSQGSPGGAFGGWSALGGLVKQLSIARNRDGRLELFGIGTDDALHRTAQSGPSAGPWTGWMSLGGVVKRIFAAQNADGRLEVLGIGSDDALWSNWQVAPGGRYSGWASLGGGVKQIAAVCNADGRMEAFAIGMDDALWHKRQAAPSAGPWSDWSSLGGNVKAFVPARNADGRIEVFAIGMDDALGHIWQSAPSAGSWSAWSSLGGGVKQIVPVVNSDGRMEVLAIGTDNALWTIYQGNRSAGPWSAWSSLGGAIKTLAATNGHDGRLEAFGIGMDDAAWQNAQTRPSAGPWTGWRRIGAPPGAAVPPPENPPPAGDEPPRRLDPQRRRLIRDVPPAVVMERPRMVPIGARDSAPVAGEPALPIAELKNRKLSTKIGYIDLQKTKKPATMSAAALLAAKKRERLWIKPRRPLPTGQIPVRPAVVAQKLGLHRAPERYPYVYDLGNNTVPQGQALTRVPEDGTDALLLWHDDGMPGQFYYVPRGFLLSRSPNPPYQPVILAAFHGEEGDTAGTMVELNFVLSPHVEPADMARLEARARRWLATRGGGQPQLMVREPSVLAGGFEWLLPTAEGGDQREIADGSVSFREGITDGLLMPLARFQRVLASIRSRSIDGVRGEVRFESPEDPSRRYSLWARLSLRQLAGNSVDVVVLEANGTSALLRLTNQVESNLQIARQATIHVNGAERLVELRDPATGAPFSSLTPLAPDQEIRARVTLPGVDLGGLASDDVGIGFIGDPTPEQLNALCAAFIGETEIPEERMEIVVETLPDFFHPAAGGPAITTLTVELQGGDSLSFTSGGPMSKTGSLPRQAAGSLLDDPRASVVTYRVIAVRSDDVRMESPWVEWDGGSPLLVGPPGGGR